jgi:zinc transport system substrate-binding protein
MSEARDRTRGNPSAAAAWLAGLCLVAGCGAPAPSDDVPLVAVSVLPQAWFVDRIAGDRVRVAVMIPPGASPAFHEPGIEQVRAIAGAALYLEMGHLPFESAWLDRLLAEQPALPVVRSVTTVDLDADPHVWVSPRFARVMARRIHAALATLLPQHREALDSNLARLLDEVDAVDAHCRRRLESRRGGTFLVFHPAWDHFAEEYGLLQIAIQREGKEPDAGALATLIQQARGAGVKVVFAQPHFDSASAEVIAAEIGARVELIDPLAYAWSDNLRQVADAIADAVALE